MRNEDIKIGDIVHHPHKEFAGTWRVIETQERSDGKYTWISAMCIDVKNNRLGPCWFGSQLIKLSDEEIARMVLLGEIKL